MKYKLLLYQILKLFIYYLSNLKNVLVIYKSMLINLVKDHYYDHKYNIDTLGLYNLKEDASLYGDEKRYQATNYDRIIKIINYLKLKENDVFVDLGCGKGRVILLASTKKIKKVIGIELRKSMVDIARKNINNFKFKKTPIEIFHCDAANYNFKEETVFFMFHPFEWKTLKIVLNNIKKSLIENPRKIHIVYHSPANYVLLDMTDWLTRETTINKCTLVWKNKKWFK